MHISRAKRRASARKAASTRARNQVKRRAAARRAAITRRRKRISVLKKSSMKRGPI